MSYDIIPVLCLILGLGGVLLIVGLKIPILLQQAPASPKEEGGEESGNRKEKILGWLSARKVVLVGLLEKLLRKIRIFSMKAENLCSYWLMQMKNKTLMPTKKMEDIETVNSPETDNVAVQVVKREDVDNALREQELIKMITRNPKNLDPYKKLADLYIEQGNHKDAEACLEQVLKIEPDNQEVKRKLERARKWKV